MRTSMCRVYVCNVWAICCVHSPPPLSDYSCFDDGSPYRPPGFINEGCPPVSPPSPTTPPPSLPPIERQRQLRSDEAPSPDEQGPSSDARLMSSIGNGHYSGGKVHTSSMCRCALPFACLRMSIIICMRTHTDPVTLLSFWFRRVATARQMDGTLCGGGG